MSSALFPSSSSSSNRSSGVLLEFRAGKMKKHTDNMVHPDARKGTLVLKRDTQPQNLIHFCWKVRNAATFEDDLIIFPDEAEFLRVSQCTTGRVYVLKFKQSPRRLFFWMQEPKEDKDEEYCKKINDYINNPSADSNETGTGSGGNASSMQELASQLGGDGGNQLSRLLSQVDRNQLAALLNSNNLEGLFDEGNPFRDSASGTDSAASQRESSSSSDRPITETPRRGTNIGAANRNNVNEGAIQLTDLQRVLSSLNTEGATAEKPSVDLALALKSDVLIPILANPDVQTRLAPHIPEGGSQLPSTEEELKKTIHTPQFRQALSMFSAALSSGQLGPLMSQFNLPQDAVTAAEKGDLEGFVKALEQKEKKSSDNDEEMKTMSNAEILKESKPKPDDDKMDES